jgi:hypothetical protein
VKSGDFLSPASYRNIHMAWLAIFAVIEKNLVQLNEDRAGACKAVGL